MKRRVQLLRNSAVLILVAFVVLGCRVSTDGIDHATGIGAGLSAGGSAATDARLPAVGPIPGASHWHAAYVVRVCNDVLAPFESTADPLGIHSHQDGVMHIHPFFEESGYEAATLGLFADAVGLRLSEGELTLPAGGTWRDGDLCDGVPGRVFVDRWSGPTDDTAVERIFVDPASIRFLADAEIYQIAFAPADSPPVVPPSTALLPEISNLGPGPDPWIDVVPGANLGQVQMWAVDQIASAPCESDQRSERVLNGQVRCFLPKGEIIAGPDAVARARAVALNRQPAVEILMAAPLRQLIDAHFARTDDALALAIEVDGFVLTAPVISRLPASERLVVSGGFSVESAIELAAILNG